MQGGPVPSPPRIRSLFCPICPLLVEHCFDRRCIFRQLLDAQVFRLVVRKAQVVLRGEQRILDFLQVRDGLVYLVDSGVEPLARYPVIAGKALFYLTPWITVTFFRQSPSYKNISKTSHRLLLFFVLLLCILLCLVC